MTWVYMDIEPRMSNDVEHGCENHVVNSIKITIKAVAVFGFLVLGAVQDVRAQVPRDPYPPFGPTPIQGPALQVAQRGPLWQNRTANSPMPVVQRPVLQGSVTPTGRADGRSERLELIARDADRHTQKAFELASRGARYSAQAEFVRALRLVAQGLDSDRECRAYSEALCTGLRALDEVEDFIPTGSQLEGDLSLREIIDRHQTTVLKAYLKPPTQTVEREGRREWLAPATPRLPTPMEAVGAYLRYAKEQLSTAAGGEVAGSMALYGLGKLYATNKGTEMDISVSRSIVCLEAATTVCPGNYLAQNQLGVLLTRSGRASEACRVFERSIAVSPQPETMVNLAKAYETLGAKESAARVYRQLAAYRAALSSQSKAPAVDWVTPEKFSESYAKTPDARQLPPVRQPNEPKKDQPVTRQADRSWPWNWTKR